ncbi:MULTISPECIES: DRTGG domain-containing protein [Aerococcus]|uniref:DRTGG domain-containing protein n=1 Tax=Aerococcus TaxID=1375 RepID=UPI0018A79654|nr:MULTISPECIES: DRTGG domain-containing protein [Aerococcus]MCY3035231.1 DRTGG domain-containing protein [Aerococcus sp. Group 2]MCY3038655.1 DRTGG domain-containing protein [Aerococcus sp. Group 2]MCY3040810.1 DRTGG domain-containing protein [Aerococcus sp. Group 2]MCY3043702.1 DRTGG domain-containing protein [Aerococcus sp. Group 2]MDK6521043.1 DRTGG domain-containing protein [Aerococcus urinae]
MTTKHEQVIQYIKDLPVDHSISVRSLARNLDVSQGTAYRGIKEAENRGLVQTIDRVGTVRVEEAESPKYQAMSVGEVVSLTNAKVFGGEQGLDYMIRDFIIGAMKVSSIASYLKPNLLMITGNRDNVQELALSHDVPVIISGGFSPSQRMVDLANQRQIPLLGVSFDSYSTVKIINKVLVERAIQQNIVLVEDIYVPLDRVKFLFQDDKVSRYRQLNEESNHTRFPVLNHNYEVVGVIAAKDILDANADTPIVEVMTPSPLVAKLKMSVASITQLMLWDNLEMAPVVDDQGKLVGIMSRQDVLYTMQFNENAAYKDYRLEILLNDKLKRAASDRSELFYTFQSDGSFANHLGTLSESLLATLINVATCRYVKDAIGELAIIESMNYYYFAAVDCDKSIQIYPEMLYHSRQNCKISIKVYYQQFNIAQAIISVNLFRQ